MVMIVQFESAHVHALVPSLRSASGSPWRLPAVPPYKLPMARLGSWIEPFPEGIYIKPADAWVDPGQPKARALVTHGHADHARGGHEEVWATAETLAIMECRYGPQPGGQAASLMASRCGSARSK